MVLCALDTWDNSLYSGNDQHIHRLGSLPEENIKKHKGMDSSVHSRGVFNGILIPLPRQMGVHAKTKSDYGE